MNKREMRALKDIEYVRFHFQQYLLDLQHNCGDSEMDFENLELDEVFNIYLSICEKKFKEKIYE